jgi:hypothetical protein
VFPFNFASVIKTFVFKIIVIGDANKWSGLEANTEKLKIWPCLATRMGKNHSIMIANRSFENVTQLRYLGTTVTIRICCRRKLGDWIPYPTAPILAAAEVIGGCRKLHNQELRILYSSPSTIKMVKSRRMRFVSRVARMDKKRNAFRILMGKLEGKRPLERPGHRYEDNIQMDLSRIGWYGLV